MICLYLKEQIDSEKEFLIREKAVKDLRLSQNARSIMLADYEKCNLPKTSENKVWEKLLKSADIHVPITFIPEAAGKEKNVTLITLAR